MSTGSLSPEKLVLLIEDDLDDQELFLLALGESRINVALRVENSAVEALQHFQTNPSYIPDLIFLDVNMPMMSGLESLAYMKELAQLRNSKILMLSTSSDQSTIESSRQLGADGFLVKPADYYEYASLLRKQLVF